MPNNRLYLTIAIGLLFPLAVMAQNPGAAPANPAVAGQVQGGVPVPGLAQPAQKEEPPTPAEVALDVAIARVKKINSYSADIVQTVDMLNQKFQIKGNCLKAPNYQIYLKLAVDGLGDTKATTLQVCDGTTLWDYREVLDTRSYSKLTLPSVLKKLNDPVLIGSPVYEAVLSRIGFGGPESMLVGLRKAVKFDQKDEQTFDGKKVWVIRGQWKDRAGLVGPGQPAPPPTANLPSYIPSNVAIWFGQDDGFPVKIEMVGRAASILNEDLRKVGPDGRKIGAKTPPPKVEPSRIVLLYNNLKLNTPIEAKEFAFAAPTGAPNVADGTTELLAFLDQAIQSETMRKKAEAAKNDPVLNSAIQVPKPDSGLPNPIPSPGLPTPPPAGPDSPTSPKK